MNRASFLATVAHKKNTIREEEKHLLYHLDTCAECDSQDPKGHRCQQGRKFWSAVEINKGELAGLVKRMGSRFA